MDIQRNIDELLKIYELEPTLRDIFVEGEYDKDFFEHYLRKKGHASVSVYTINYINIPSDSLHTHAQNNNKGRLITLSLILDSELPDRLDVCRCIIDADYDHITHNYFHSRYLRYLDFSCLEMYFLNYSNLLAIFSAFTNYNFSEDDHLHLFSLFREISILKYYFSQLAPDIGWISPIDDCRPCNGYLLNRVRFLNRLLTNRGRNDLVNQINQLIEEPEDYFPDDSRVFIHGHTLIDFITEMVNSGRNAARRFNVNDLQRTLYLSIDVNQLLQYDFFSNLETWLENS